MHDLGGQDVRTQTRGNLQVSLSIVMTLELILQVTCELLHRNAEQIFDEVASQTDTLVGIVVLVIGFLVFDGHLKDLSNDAAEEDGLLLSIASSFHFRWIFISIQTFLLILFRERGFKVRKQFLVQ